MLMDIAKFNILVLGPKTFSASCHTLKKLSMFFWVF